MVDSFREVFLWVASRESGLLVSIAFAAFLIGALGLIRAFIHLGIGVAVLFVAAVAGVVSELANRN